MSRARMMKAARSDKQKRILAYLLDGIEAEASLDDIVRDLPEVRTAHRSKSYLGQTMTKMIRKGLVRRVRPGVFRAVRSGSGPEVAAATAPAPPAESGPQQTGP